jgi:5-methyltetrahydrofolate corrinoid/iron sulfur protein methyltransferase
MARGKFIAVGENIHCTRIYKVGGEFVKEAPAKGWAIVYKEGGKEKHLPVPRTFLDSGDWAAGKVKHAAVGIWQGVYGDPDGKKAGVEYLHYMVRNQEAHGAHFLDLNVDEFSTEVEERRKIIRWTAQALQEVSSVPLSIDSSNVEILRTGLEACKQGKGKPMVNSVSLERKESIRLAAAAGAVVIAAAGGEASMPTSKEERLANAARLLELLHKEGLKEGDVYLDPLVFPVSVDPNNGRTILETIAELRRNYGPAIHFAPGLSNISYGMPNRKLINQVFTRLCVQQGLDGGIVDPLQINDATLAGLDEKAESFRLTRAFLLGEDMYGMNYISAVRAGTI